MRRLLIAISAAWPALAGKPARAHAFETGADAYAQVLEGIAVILTYPGILLPIMALGVVLSLWTLEGLVLAWPVYLLGQVAGVFLGAFVGAWIAVALIAVGVLTATLAALLPRHPAGSAMALAGGTGVLAMAAALEGHGLFELSGFIHLGLFIGANLAVAVVAGLARVALEKVDAPWMRIGWRVVASWIGAILLLYLAFEMTGGVS